MAGKVGSKQSAFLIGTISRARCVSPGIPLYVLVLSGELIPSYSPSSFPSPVQSWVQRLIVYCIVLLYYRWRLFLLVGLTRRDLLLPISMSHS